VADSLFTGKELQFADGESRHIKPLTISQLRKFVKLIDGLDADMTSLSDDDIDKMIDAAAIILSKVDPALAEDREKLEDAVDVSVFSAMIAVAMGTDPNA
jgi:hypothetical protein